MKNQTRNKLILLALFGLFFVPVLLAYLMNAGYLHYRPQPSKNHGDLVNPPIEMRQYSQNPLLADNNDLWKLVYVNHGPCDSDCVRMLDAVYRIYLATGRHRAKVKPVVVYPQAELALPQGLGDRFEKVSLAGEPRAQALFDRLSRQSLGQGGGFYIIAPEGFLMMSYPKGFNPSGTIKDMNVLLKRKDG